MLTQKVTSQSTVYSIPIQDKSLDDLLNKEWLLTNSRGGFSSSSIIGCNTRRYHGLLTGSRTPPANRITALSNCLETLNNSKEQFSLSSFEFDQAMHPNGYAHLLEFRKDVGVHFEYKTPLAKVSKSIYLLPDCDIAAFVYAFSDIRDTFTFTVRPFISMCDFHALRHTGAELNSVWDERQLNIQSDLPESGHLILYSKSMQFEQDAQWWHRFFYRVERQRGQDCFEDLWSPGEFCQTIDGPVQIILWAGLFSQDDPHDVLIDMEIETALDALRLKQKGLLRQCSNSDPVQCKLTLAADQFVIERAIDDKPTPSILAGFPWFLDWGRDTFISLEGICLTTGQYETAWGVLETFAKAVSEGMIPNRFDDYGQMPHYNSIDASQWFVHAAFQYLDITRDLARFSQKLLPAVKWVMDSYRKGTRFGICADSDKLLTGGDVNTQLTWMDAKFNEIAFTPRYGKAVEVNALWYSNLCRLAEYCRESNAQSARFYELLAEQVRYAFQSRFWNNEHGYLNDCIFPNGKVDSSIRPNQIFAVSLRHSPLLPQQQKSVVEIVEKELLTPYGLRSLSPSDPRYKRRYKGPQGQRDAAYHQGTVWGFLIGPFVEAYLKVHSFEPAAKRRSRSFLNDLITHLDEDACIGSISEIFDGDAPHHPRGTIAQAWSVAETLRAWQMCKE